MAFEDPAAQTFAFAQQAQQQVLCLDANRSMLTRLEAGEEQDTPGALRVALEDR